MGYVFSARAAAVHALFRAARDKDDFGVLASQLHRDVRVGIIFADGDKRRLHFLYEGDTALFRKSQPCAARDGGLKALAFE